MGGHGRRVRRAGGRRRAGAPAAAAAPTPAEAFTKELGAALDAASYPAKADPARINNFMVVLLLWVLVIYVTMVYGPIAAMLVELFPTRIRYTSMSLPYHIGNGWFGGFLPPTAFAIVAATGNIYSGLWYPIVGRRRDLRDRDAVRSRDQGRRHLRQGLRVWTQKSLT